jgi:hypothetical protein
MIAHSHEDMGWLSTAEEYYSSQVDQILTNVMNALVKDKKRKYTHAEIGFFVMWWRKQDNHKQNQVKELVNNGQLEFANGGWVASDEACQTYIDLIQNI